MGQFEFGVSNSANSWAAFLKKNLPICLWLAGQKKGLAAILHAKQARQPSCIITHMTSRYSSFGSSLSDPDRTRSIPEDT